MDFACSYGEGDLPRNITRSGVHVVTEKYEDFYMSNPAAGYSNVHERFAVRISNNGEFIHCNPNSIGAQGNTNVTNGCINLQPRERPAVLQQCDLRRPRRGDRHLDRPVLRRRRSLGLGRAVGGVDVDVGAVVAGSAVGNPEHRPRDAFRRAATGQRPSRRLAHSAGFGASLFVNFFTASLTVLMASRTGVLDVFGLATEASATAVSLASG